MGEWVTRTAGPVLVRSRLDKLAEDGQGQGGQGESGHDELVGVEPRRTRRLLGLASAVTQLGLYLATRLFRRPPALDGVQAGVVVAYRVLDVLGKVVDLLRQFLNAVGH